MAEYIDREALIQELDAKLCALHGELDENRIVYDAFTDGFEECVGEVEKFQFAADVAPVVHWRWILEAHDERVNYRWNVTAECSECCDEQKEIWAGFFPNVPPPIARDAALVSAESVKLSNYCPNCGADMRGSNDE